MSDTPLLTEEEHATLNRIASALGVIGEVFGEGEGTPGGLRMAIAAVREGIVVLEDFVDRWEAYEHSHGTDG